MRDAGTSARNNDVRFGSVDAGRGLSSPAFRPPDGVERHGKGRRSKEPKEHDRALGVSRGASQMSMPIGAPMWI
jgi:hypothetical protein